MAIKRIGILTGGGDVPGLNAVIKSATQRSENDIEIFGPSWLGGAHASRTRAVGRNVYGQRFAASISTPGRTLPSSHSRKAPPAVET